MIVGVDNKLKVTRSDIRNTFLHTEVLEKVYAIARLEFGEREGYKIEIVKNMHVMVIASRV